MRRATYVRYILEDYYRMKDEQQHQQKQGPQKKVKKRKEAGPLVQLFRPTPVASGNPAAPNIISTPTTTAEALTNG